MDMNAAGASVAHSAAPGAAGPTYDDHAALMTLMTGDEKHELAAESALDVLWVLYDKILRVSPQDGTDDSRDRFYLSKGHGPMAYYAVLAAKGFLDPGALPGFATFGSPLGEHPDRTLVPGAEISSGSLGHGLPLAVGTALGLRCRGLGARVFVLIGDGELDESSNHEAIAFAGTAEQHQAAHGLDARIGRASCRERV